MTLDEMIDAVESEKRAALSNMSYETAEQIIAALKAGQALRDWPYTPNKSWNEVSKAWDAATKGDDK